MAQINDLAREVLTNSLPRNSLSLVLVLSVIAVGRHALENQAEPLQSGLPDSGEVFAEACCRVKHFLLGHNSLLKLQVGT